MPSTQRQIDIYDVCEIAMGGMESLSGEDLEKKIKLMKNYFYEINKCCNEAGLPKLLEYSGEKVRRLY